MDTKLQPNKGLILFYLFGFVLLILTLISIPTYFIFKSEFENNKNTKFTQLQYFANKIAQNYTPQSNLPLSLIFLSAVYNEDGELIQTTSQKSFPSDVMQIKSQMGDSFFYKKRLDDNALLVIATKTEKEIIYIKMSLTILALFIFLLLSTWFLVQMVITPYQRINRYLDAFFNDAMHELKTPIGVIQFNLELLEQKEPGKKEVKRAMNGVKGLQFIYEDIEYLIKHKNIAYQSEIIDFSSTLFHRIDFFNSFAKSKKIAFKAKIDEHCYVKMNNLELQRVIDNTLSNAIKYSKPNSQIIIKLYQTQDRVIFSVQDFGQGIKDIGKIFQRFHREDQNKGGFGIGLNIVKTICDKNKIQIDVQSQVDKTTTFTYSFTPEQPQD